MLPTCKVEAYGVQREFGTETCKPKLLFPFVHPTLLLPLKQEIMVMLNIIER